MWLRAIRQIFQPSNLSNRWLSSIVQERVEVPSELWPAWTDGALHLGERMLDTAPFLTDGITMSGCLTRIATDPLLNVTAGGGSNVPTFLVEQR